MREIEFRAWNVEEKIMHDVAFPTWGGFVDVWANNIPQSKTQLLHLGGPDNMGILEQHTGIIDKHGKKIFEGDIVSCKIKKSGPFVIVFEDGAFKRRTTKLDSNYSYPLLRSEIHLFEVVGTIHD